MKLIKILEDLITEYLFGAEIVTPRVESSSCELVKFIRSYYGQQLETCSDIDELDFRGAFVAINCLKLSGISGGKPSDGVIIARETARLIKESLK